MNQPVTIDNGVCRLRFEAAPACSAMLGWLLQFLSPSFAPSAALAEADVTIHISPFAALPAETAASATTPVAFRRSACPEYNLSGRSGRDGQGRVVAIDPISQTGYRIDGATQRVDIHVNPDNPGSAIHLHDFTRYLALLICQSRGHILLHASAAMLGDRLALVLGTKGAGKTTTMLRLVVEQGGRYFSGDKVLASVTGGQLVLRAWPDIPYIGVGSLGQFPGLAERLGLSLIDAGGKPLAPRTKLLVDPLRFRQVLPQASKAVWQGGLPIIVLPDVSAASGAIWVARHERHAADLASVIEWPDEFLTAQWHRLYLDAARRGCPDRGADVLARLAEAPWLMLNGPIAPPQVLDHLDALDREAMDAAS